MPGFNWKKTIPNMHIAIGPGRHLVSTVDGFAVALFIKEHYVEMLLAR